MAAVKPARSRFGSERFFHVGGTPVRAGGWYVETREGIKGPFPSRSQAERFLVDLKTAHPRKRIANWHTDPSNSFKRPGRSRRS